MDTKLETTLRKVTRYVVGSAHRPHLTGYIDYEQRLRMLHQLSLRTRRVITAVVTIEKIYLGKLIVAFRQYIMEAHVDDPTQHRLRLRYKINHPHFAIDSPIYVAMMETNSLRYQFEVQDSIHTIRRKLIEYFTDAND